MDWYFWFSICLSVTGRLKPSFESASRLGGNTVEAQFGEISVPVDTGFIVYNPLNYQLISFDQLDVPNQASDMSFSVSLNKGAMEYEGSIKGLLAPI